MLKIKYKSRKAKKGINKWLEALGITSVAFISALYRIGIEGKVYRFSDTEKENQFFCVTDIGKKYKIRLVYGDYVDECFQIDIYLIDKENEYLYIGYEVYGKESLTIEPYQILYSKDGKFIYRGAYFEYWCQREILEAYGKQKSIKIDGKKVYDRNLIDIRLNSDFFTFDKILIEKIKNKEKITKEFLEDLVKDNKLSHPQNVTSINFLV